MNKKKGPALNTKVYESDATASEAEDNGQINSKASNKKTTLEQVQQKKNHKINDTDEKPEHQRKGIVTEIVNANRRALDEMNQQEEKFDMMDGLEEIAEEQQPGAADPEQDQE